MTRRSLGISLFVLILFPLYACVAKKKNMLEIPEGSAGIIAYGSLISLPSLEQSLGHEYEGPVREVHLRGYERVWACVRPWRSGAKKFDAYILRGAERMPILGAAELNLSSKKKARINAVLYLVTEEDLHRMDEREWGYRRVDVTGKIEEFRFRGGKVYAYEGLPGPQPDFATENGTYILLKGYLDTVTNACDSRGKDFCREFDETTTTSEFDVVPFEDIIWGKEN